MENPMKELNIIKFSGSGFEYVVTIYDDETEFKYYENNGDDELQLRSSISFPANGQDIQIFNKVIQLREMLKTEKR